MKDRNLTKLFIAAIALSVIIIIMPWRGTTDTVNVKVVRIGGCQYLKFENSSPAMPNYSFAITHSGTCDNPVHAKP